MEAANEQLIGRHPSHRPRVLFFDAYPHVYAGAQRVMHLEASLLAERGMTTAVAAPSGGPFIDALAADGIETMVVPTPKSLSHYGRTTTGGKAIVATASLPAYWARLTRVMRTWRPDLVHINDHRGLVLAAAPARAARAKLVWHVEGVEIGSRLTPVGLRLAHRVLVPAAAVIDRMPELAGHDKVKVVINPGPVLSGPLVPPPTDPHMVTAARLHPDKGLDVLFHALALVRAELPAARLTILGDTQTGWEQYPAELATLAAELGVADAVTYAGQVDDVTPWLHDSRVYVQSSRERTEIMPLAVLEAMAAGRAVVTTAVGALGEVVVDGKTGYLVPPEDVAALARALTTALGEPGTAERLGAAGRVAVVGFGPDRFAAELLAVYETLGVYAAPIEG